MEALGFEAAGRGVQPARQGQPAAAAADAGGDALVLEKGEAFVKTAQPGEERGGEQQPLVAVDGLLPVERAFLLQVAIAEAVPVVPAVEAEREMAGHVGIRPAGPLQRPQGAGEQVRVRQARVGVQEEQHGALGQAGGSVHLRAPAARGRDHPGSGRGGDCGGGIGGTAVGNEHLQPHPLLAVQVREQAGQHLGLVQGRDNHRQLDRVRRTVRRHQGRSQRCSRAQR